MKLYKYIDMKLPGFGLVFLAILLCAACGATVIRGESPMVRMNELSHLGKHITLQLSMRNINGVPLDIESINFKLTVEDNDLFFYNGPAETNIVANGTETWSVEIEESQTSREMLDTLQSGEVKSLPYLLKGSIISKDDGTLRFEHEGHIYPLPGRPGYFR
jgi:hypothetical protein